MHKKYKLITIGDHPLAPSGVGLQTRYIIDHLVKTGKYKIISIAGAIRHQNYSPQKFEGWGDDVVILPSDGYGNKDLLRQLIDIEKPDAIWFMTDPRFYVWLWEMEDEVHQQCPLIYAHLWDNPPYPQYNEHYYKSTDFIGCINRLTYKFLDEQGFKNIDYIPHGVPSEDYKILSSEEVSEAKVKHLNNKAEGTFVGFYNSRNALRKRTGNVIWAFRLFLDMLPPEEAKDCVLAMHTPPRDPEGQNLFEVVKALNMTNNIGFNDEKIPNSVMAEFYNLSDFTISLSSEEGFGLSCLESLYCGTPVVVSKTGGLQDQVVDWETGEVFGHCLEPDATSLIGSQTTPYIESHHIDPKSAALAIYDLYQKKKEFGSEYKEKVAGQAARDSVLRRFDLPKIQKKWEEVIEREILKFKNQNRLNFRAVSF